MKTKVSPDISNVSENPPPVKFNSHVQSSEDADKGFLGLKSRSHRPLNEIKEWSELYQRSRNYEDGKFHIGRFMKSFLVNVFPFPVNLFIAFWFFGSNGPRTFRLYYLFDVFITITVVCT